jgi:hypothetical protein
MRNVVLLIIGGLWWGSMASHAADIRRENFDPRNLPDQAVYRGKVVASAHWYDGYGDNLLLLTETGAFRSPTAGQSDDTQDAELYGYLYVRTGTDWHLLWKLYDFEKDCPLDLSVEFLPKSLTVTDLDDDGIAETTFLYKLACRSDVSPARLKLMMREGETKYAIRGSMRLPKQFGITGGGQRELDPAFAKAPPGFKAFALKRWQAFIEGKMSE